MRGIRLNKRVQYGIVSHGETEMLITNGRIAQLVVDVQRDPAEVEWDMKFGSSPLNMVFPRHEYFDTSAFQRIKDEKPIGEVITAADADTSGITRGIQIEVRGRLCSVCHAPSYVTLYLYSSARSKDEYQRQIFCLSCLEAAVRTYRSTANDQP